MEWNRLVVDPTLSDQDRIDEVVALLREAELDDAVWPAASALIDDVCGLQGSDLILGTLGEAGIDIRLRWLFLRGEPRSDLARDYVENYAAIDERPAAGAGVPFGRLVHTRSLLPDRVRRRSATYNEYLLPSGGENCLNVKMPGPGNLKIAWSLVGPGGGSTRDWTSEQTDAIRLLMPHVRQFVRVRHALAEARAEGMRTAALLGAERLAMLLLDRHGRIVEANDRARGLLACRDGLAVRHGRLTGVRPADADAVDRVLGAACRGGSGASTPITRRAAAPLVLHATPARTRGSSRWECYARILIAEPFAPPRIDARKVSEALGLTPAQGRVVAGLAAGDTVASIAIRAKRSEAAVRWHIREALQRLGLARQTDLVRVVLSTPGVLDDDRD